MFTSEVLSYVILRRECDEGSFVRATVPVPGLASRRTDGWKDGCQRLDSSMKVIDTTYGNRVKMLQSLYYYSSTLLQRNHQIQEIVLQPPYHYQKTLSIKETRLVTYCRGIAS